jgi:hypothetical protein
MRVRVQSMRVETTAPTVLTVTLRFPGQPSVTRVLRDPPVDGDAGDHPHPAAALSALATVPDPFAPVPPGTMATMVYGGPQTATVSGTWRGVPVDTTFCRTDGAQIHRWELVAPLLDIGESAEA